MKKFVLALDFDGVITDPYIRKRRELIKLGYRNIKDTSYEYCVLGQKVKKEHYDLALERSVMDERVPLQKGLVAAYKRISSLPGIAVAIVTSRYNNMMPNLRRCLLRNRISVWKIINTRNKSKLDVLKNMSADIFVDDSPHKLREIVGKIGRKCVLVLLLNLNNRYLNVNKKIRSASGWKNLKKIIIRIYNERQSK